MEPQGSLPHSQESATCSCSETSNQSVPSPTSGDQFECYSLQSLGFPNVLFTSDFLTKTLYTYSCPTRVTYPPPNLIFLDLFTLAILGQQYRTSRYAVFSNSPLPRHCYSQISSSAPCSQTPYELRASLYVRQSFTTCKIMYFLMYCWPSILVLCYLVFQLDAQFLFYIYCIPLHVSSTNMLIFRRINCIYTASGSRFRHSS